MIYSIFHSGSGVGNQLHRYVMARVLALDKNYEFGTIAQENSKMKSFMSLDFGGGETIHYVTEIGTGKVVPSAWETPWDEWNKYCYDPDINFVRDNTIIDGNFEDERYFEHRLPEIQEWLKVQPMLMGDNLCIINFRGGEYKYVPELYLPQEYWDRAIMLMKQMNPEVVFEVHTDDIEEARKFFPHYPIVRDVGINWRSIRYTKHLIIGNSSFAVLPALLNDEVREIIAPKYWNRYNLKRWDYPQGYYKKFMYI